MLALLVPATSSGHAGHAHAVFGPPPPPGLWDGAAAVRDATNQARFTRELLELPAERNGACGDTGRIDGIGDACRTEDGLLRIPRANGEDLVTHGPDFAESSTDVSSRFATYITAAVQTASKDDVACVASTSAHYRVVFASPADSSVDTADQVADLRQAVYEMSAVIDARSRSLVSSASRKLPVLCDGSGDAIVDDVRLPHTQAEVLAAGGVSTVVDDVEALIGLDEGSNARTIIYYDEHLGSFSGVGSFSSADAPVATNTNNRSGRFALQDDSWGIGRGPNWSTLLHEVSHNLGAVPAGSNGSNAVGHCNDGLDTMCYGEPDTPGVSGTYSGSVCAVEEYDCNADSYFHPAPAAGSWLDTHWNPAHVRNRYLRAAAVVGDSTPPAQVTGVTGTGHGDFIRLSWDPVADSDVHAYRVEYDTGAGWNSVTDSWPGDTTVDVELLEYLPITTATLRVIAFDELGNAGTPSASATIALGSYDSESASSGGPAPDDVTDLVVSDATSSSITLSWLPPTDNLGYVYVDRWNGASWTVIANDAAYDVTYTDTGRAAGTQYRYRVRVVSSRGVSSTGVEVTGWTSGAGDVTAPATPGSFTVASSSGTMPVVTWDAVGDATAYQLTTSPATDTTWSSGTSARIGGLAHGTAYTISLRAKDEAGNLSTAATTTFTAPALGDVTAPTVPSSTADCSPPTRTTTSLEARWNPAGFADDTAVVAYRPFAVPADGSHDYVQGPKLSGQSTSSGTVTGLQPGTTYDLYVIAFDAAGNATTSYWSCGSLTTLADTAAPTQPGSLAVTDVGQDQVDLSWTASTDDSAVASYRIWRTTPGPSELVATVTHPTTTASITGLSELTAYTFEVEAVDLVGTASTRASVSTTTASSDSTPPSQPGSLATGTITGSSVALSWSASSDDVAVTGYEVRNGSATGAVLATTTSTSTTVTGLDDGTSYTLAVVSRDAAGNRSTAATVTVTTLDTTAPDAPGSLTADSTTGSSIDVSWSAPTDNVAVTGYRIRLDGSDVDTTTATSYSLTGLTDATTYTIAVFAYDAAGNLGAPATLDVTTLDVTAPAAPTGLAVASQTDVRVTLDWTAATDNVAVTSYRVFELSDMTTPVATPTSGPVLVDGLTADTDYTFYVTAVDAAGNESDWSDLVPVRTDALPDTTPPSTPGALAIDSITTAGMRLQWTASTDASGIAGYDVERSDGSGWVTVALGQPELAFTASALSQATSYSWRVSARDAAGNRSAFATASAATLLGPDVSAPTRPPGTLGLSSPGPGIVDLAWGVSFDDRGVAGYRVYRNVGVGYFLVATTTATSIRLGSQPEGLTVTYAVTAYDAAGNASPATSGAVYVQATPPPPPAPIAPAAGVSATRYATGFRIAWTPQDSRATSYRIDVRRGTTVVARRWTTGTSIGVWRLVPRTGYAIDVYSLAATGQSVAATTSASTTADLVRPTRPAWLRSRALTGGRLRLWWYPSRDNDRVVRYEIRLRAYRTRTRIVRTTGPRRIQYVGRLKRNTRYVVDVRAVDRSGNRSAWRSIGTRTLRS